MIVSASYRTDIPAYYGAWFGRRLAAGFALVANPYGGAPYRVSLAPAEVDGFVFWTRNAGPFLPALAATAERGIPFVVQFTITGYPRALEAGTLAPEAAAAQLAALARRFGRRVAVWRYDPIVIGDLTPPAWHRENFAALARRLDGASDEAVISFAEPYRKTRRNLEAAARRHGFAWRDPPAAEKQALIEELSAVAAEFGMRLTLCAQPGLAGEASRCIDAARLSDVAGVSIAAPTKGNRPGCLCALSRDIGAYDSCAQGCAYCYAVADRASAQATLQRHDSDAPMLAPARPLA
jgi:hypothetical protein